MLVNVEVRNSQGDLLNLPLEDISDGLILDDIDGLNPVKATIVSSSFAQQDGSQYHSSRRESRNLKLRIGLEPDYVTQTVRDLRNRLYNFFMPKTPVGFQFHDSSGLVVEIDGRVETCETALFVKEPAVDVSIICFDPDFIDLELIEVSEMTTAGSTEFLVHYSGTTETGILFTLNVDRTLSEFTIFHRPPDGTLRSLNFVGSLIAGDVLKINTVSGNKGLTLTRSGIDSSALYGMSPSSNWVELFPGDNYIRVHATGAAIPFDISYISRYGGL